MNTPSLEERKAMAERLRQRARASQIGKSVGAGDGCGTMLPSYYMPSDFKLDNEAADLLDRLTDGELVQTYTEVCKNEKCPRGGLPVEILSAPTPPRVEADRETIARETIRCDVTKHLIGTDTEMIGAPPCACNGHRLYAILAARPTLSESEDYVLVPREPTEEMLRVETNPILRLGDVELPRVQQWRYALYKAMIAATPSDTNEIGKCQPVAWQWRSTLDGFWHEIYGSIPDFKRIHKRELKSGEIEIRPLYASSQGPTEAEVNALEAIWLEIYKATESPRSSDCVLALAIIKRRIGRIRSLSTPSGGE